MNKNARSLSEIIKSFIFNKSYKNIEFRSEEKLNCDDTLTIRRVSRRCERSRKTEARFLYIR